MRFVFVILLFLKTTLVFAQNDSSIIVKGHLRAVLQKAQEEDKMILLFPTKKYVFSNEDYKDSELYISSKNLKKGNVSIFLRPYKQVYDIEGWLTTFKNIFPENYIISNIDFSYGEGLYFRNRLPLSATYWQLNESVLIMKKDGSILRIISREDRDGLFLAYKELNQESNPIFTHEYLLKEFPNYEDSLKKRNELWKMYKKNKTDKAIIKELYRLNLYFDVLDCEVKDKYFEVRLKENKSNFFEDEDEFLLYVCNGDSKVFDFFTTYTSRSYLTFYWMQKFYKKAVESKDESIFQKYLTTYDITNCHCHCDEKNYEIAKYYFDIGNYSNMKLYAEKQLNMSFFDLNARCWKKVENRIQKMKLQQ